MCERWRQNQTVAGKLVRMYLTVLENWSAYSEDTWKEDEDKLLILLSVSLSFIIRNFTSIIPYLKTDKKSQKTSLFAMTEPF